MSSLMHSDQMLEKGAGNHAMPSAFGEGGSSVNAEADYGWPLNRHQKRLLLVDDDDVDRERISRFVKKCSLPLILLDATSGTDAMKIIAHEEVDLILLDYHLGDMTGTEFLSMLKHANATMIPTIMVTGMGDERAAMEALRLGVRDYLPKRTLTAESLLSVLESVLRTADLERRLHEAQENLQRLSLYDELTGLPNRHLFFDRLEQALLAGKRNESHFSLLMIDLNLFKEVNDSLGHSAGDKVLAEIGQRLQEVGRQSDTLARIGGDEFACILHDVDSANAAIACAEKILSSISQPIAIGDKVAQVGASIGIACYPAHGDDATILLSNADSAMYAAKKSHRRYYCYNGEDSAAGTARIPVTAFLAQAIQNHELILEYQPKMQLTNGEIVGVEALVRWNSRQFGWVMPDDFIPVAERSSLIDQLTYATIELAFDQMREWLKLGIEIPVAINLSARLLDTNEELPKRLVRCLDEHGLPSKLVTLEITETALASSSLRAHRTLTELQEIGVGLSIDDFGSGFTSFRNIRDIAFSELKIDRMFIESLRIDNREAAIVRSMLGMADGLGMRAVAEGVESPRQLELLRMMGCDFAQGFSIARPMSAKDFIAWFEARIH